MTERYDSLLIKQRLCREALASCRTPQKRYLLKYQLERIDAEIAELGSPPSWPVGVARVCM